jgi:hypothetical protein
MCLALRSGSGLVSCRSTTSSTCNSDEFGVVSLSQTEDSHVGAFFDYGNKVCCKVVLCPTDFHWDGINQTCKPSFLTCYIRNNFNGQVDQNQLCKSRFTKPIQTALPGTSGSQTGPYWNDALSRYTDDCFAQSPSPVGQGDNARACCFAATYANTEYGSYQDIDATALKKCTIGVDC